MHAISKMPHRSFIARFFNLREDSFRKRTLLFYLVCVPVRSTIAFVAYNMLQYGESEEAPETVWQITILLFSILAGAGFAKQFKNQKRRDRGKFLGIVWWPRDVHAFILRLPAAAVAFGWIFDIDISAFVLFTMLADVVFGVYWRQLADSDDSDCDVDEGEATAMNESLPMLPASEYKLRF
jgi:hypothetical protein